MPSTAQVHRRVFGALDGRAWQKRSAFRPGSMPPGEIWTVVCDKVDGIIHRYFYASDDNNSTFDLRHDFTFAAGDNAEEDIAVRTCSWVFSADGNKIHAVTVDPFDVTGSGNWNIRLFYGIIDLITGDIEKIPIDTIVNLSFADLGFLRPDIILDQRVDPKPIIVVRVFTTALEEVRIYGYNNSDELVSSVVSGDGINPDGEISIVKHTFPYYFVHADYDGVNSIVYPWIPFNPGGSPYIPETGDWSGFDVGIPKAQMAAGDDSIGFLGGKPLAATNLIFKSFVTEVSDEEIVAIEAREYDGYGLCYRGGTWHALYGSDDVNPVKYRIRNVDLGEWEDGTGSITSLDDEWGNFGITLATQNPPPRDQYEFGIVITDLDSPYDVKFMLVDDWFTEPPLPTGNYWDKGQLTNSDLIAINIDDESVQFPLGNSRRNMIDVLDVKHDLVWTDQNTFMVRWDQFKQFLQEVSDEFTYSNIIFDLESPPRRAGNDEWKLLKEVIFEFQKDIEEAAVNRGLYIVNETGKYIYIDFTDVNNVSNKPVYPGFWGRQFWVRIFENSESSFTPNRVILRGQYMGTLG